MKKIFILIFMCLLSLSTFSQPLKKMVVSYNPGISVTDGRSEISLLSLTGRVKQVKYSLSLLNFFLGEYVGEYKNSYEEEDDDGLSVIGADVLSFGAAYYPFKDLNGGRFQPYVGAKLSLSALAVDEMLETEADVGIIPHLGFDYYLSRKTAVYVESGYKLYSNIEGFSSLYLKVGFVFDIGAL